MNDVVVSEVVYGYLRASSGLKPYELRKEILNMSFNFEPLENLLGMFNFLGRSLYLSTNSIMLIPSYKEYTEL